MKNTILILLLLITCMSCNEGWDGETKELYLEACRSEAKEWATDEKVIEDYCSCNLSKVMTRYPDYVQALSNIMDDTALHREIGACREIQNK